MAAQHTTLDAALLRGWPLPALSDAADKETRGRILLIAGSREIPGAAVLAATAALRAGAGKLAIATGASVAAQMAFAMPEARVIPIPETAAGGLDAAAASILEGPLRACHACVIGPGLMDSHATQAFVRAMLPWLAGQPLVLDALAMDSVFEQGQFDGPVLLTPHAGEMAHLTGLAKEEVLSDPASAARAAAQRWNAVVALKGPCTVIATPQGQLWQHEGGNSGLATSGSGDTLAGAIGGLAARGAPVEQACAWGVVLHAMAGDALSRRLGPVGYLAREIPAAMLAVLRCLQAQALTPGAAAPTQR